jgi:hypothetical protein
VSPAFRQLSLSTRKPTLVLFHQIPNPFKITEKSVCETRAPKTFKFYFVFTQKSLHACMSFWLDQMSIIIDVVFAAFSQNS